MQTPNTTARWKLTAALTIGLGLVALGAAGAADKAAPKKVSADKSKATALKPSAAANAKLDAAELANLIDKAIDARIAEEKVAPSPRTTDEEFLRRVYLDLTGRIPSPEKALAFLDSKESDKRAKLIDELLAAPEYGTHQADIWQALLIARSTDNRRVSFDPFVKWLETQFNENKPWDKLSHELLTASGTADENPATLFTVSQSNMNRFAVDRMTGTVGKVFLGVQIQCAQCHNHPFTDWKQDEYWAMAAFFGKVVIQAPRNANNADVKPGVNENAGRGGPRGQQPEGAKTVPAKFLQGEKPTLKQSEAYRPVFAKWATAKDNPYFSKAMVNRTWAQLFGRGFVNPIDDMHDNNGASHPQLLADLSRQFALADFDLKHLIRGICNSQTYQRSSKPFKNNDEAAPELFARMAIKVLTPEQLFDSYGVVLGPQERGGPQARRAMGMGMRGLGNNPRAAFVAFFGLEENVDPTEFQAGIPQVLRLMNSAMTNNQGGARLLKADKPVEANLETLFLASLSRRPTQAEVQKMGGHVKKATSSREGFADVLWAILNSSEFQVNR